MKSLSMALSNPESDTISLRLPPEGQSRRRFQDVQRRPDFEPKWG